MKSGLGQPLYLGFSDSAGRPSCRGITAVCTSLLNESKPAGVTQSWSWRSTMECPPRIQRVTCSASGNTSFAVSSTAYVYMLFRCDRFAALPPNNLRNAP